MKFGRHLVLLIFLIRGLRACYNPLLIYLFLAIQLILFLYHTDLNACLSSAETDAAVHEDPPACGPCHLPVHLHYDHHGNSGRDGGQTTVGPLFVLVTTL